MDIKQYWKSIMQVAASFDPEAAQRDANEHDPSERTHLKRSEKPVWLISVDNAGKQSRGGQVVGVFPVVAAQMLAENTHVLATADQLTAHEADMAKRKAEIEAAELKREGKNMPDEIKDLVRSVAAIAHQTQPAQRGNKGA